MRTKSKSLDGRKGVTVLLSQLRLSLGRLYTYMLDGVLGFKGFG